MDLGSFHMTQSLQIDYRPVGELIPYIRNSRTHSDEQIDQVAASIREFGFTNPILLDGDNSFIVGHGRLLAAPVVVNGSFWRMVDCG